MERITQSLRNHTRNLHDINPILASYGSINHVSRFFASEWTYLLVGCAWSHYSWSSGSMPIFHSVSPPSPAQFLLQAPSFLFASVRSSIMTMITFRGWTLDLSGVVFFVVCSSMIPSTIGDESANHQQSLQNDANRPSRVATSIASNILLSNNDDLTFVEKSECFFSEKHQRKKNKGSR